VGQVGKTRRSSQLHLPASPALPAFSRRDFLAAALLLPSFARQNSSERFVSNVPLTAPGAQPPPFGRLLGAGLDARLFTDLSAVVAPRTPHLAPLASADAPRTSVNEFFVRTAAPKALPAAWTVNVAGLVRTPLDLNLRDLEPLATQSGRYLMECSGNSDPSNFGLISTADWDGVSLAAILDRVKPPAASYRVLISGVDDEGAASRTSVPGASWIFSRDDLSHALLALRMNGAPLPRDHGFPVRLIVPGWYGCACIKWVDRIDLVPDEAPATTQMQEFAARTHQNIAQLRTQDPPLARDFIPAVIDTAAMPVRVEKWLAGGRLEYRITGIIWGGSTPTNTLSIRFKTSQPWTPVDDCPMPASTLTWSLWSHTWRPDAPGRYQIVLKVTDRSIRTRRLDLFFYVREIAIDEI
jgi:DMSO/TMAO reductase YedYZ molybdopterin-dependent catalytic subunit